MPVFQLSEEISFPTPDQAEPDGLLAVGGDLSPERLMLAYALGIFPWFSDGDPILWWSPEPRLVLEPAEIHITKSLRRILNAEKFTVTFDTAFADVIKNCAAIARKRQDGTWITAEMQQAYQVLHNFGFAHSVETWFDGELVGGLYGISLGKIFCGESMFAFQSDASKVALATLCKLLTAWEFDLIDCQVPTPHLLRMGAYEISRETFLDRLQSAVQHPTHHGSWQQESPAST